MIRKIFLLSILCVTCLLGCANNEESKPDTTPEVETQPEPEPEKEPIDYVDLKFYIDDDKDLKILQLTDTHFGDENKAINNGKVDITLQYMDYLIENGKPDIILCTGDNIVDTGVSGAEEFVEIMDALETPWVWVFGNHDATHGIHKEPIATRVYELSLESDYLMYTEDYIDTEYHRYGNFVIEVYNKQSETLRGGLVCLDTGVNDFVNPLVGYEALSEGQVDWYVEAIEKLDEKFEGEGVVPTILFQHMHTPVFYDAYLNAEEYKYFPESQTEYRGEYVIEQFLCSLNIDAIKDQGNSDDKGMFEEIVRLGSTKAIFVGHTHFHKLQYTYDGVLLGFGPQTGYANGFFGDDGARSTYMYHVSPNFDIVTEDIKQPTLILSDSEITLNVGETFETNYFLNDIEGDVEFTLSNNNISYTRKNDSIFITGLIGGECTITLNGPYELEQVITITIKEIYDYVLYDEKGNVVIETTSLYKAIDEMFVLGLENDSYVERKESKEVVFVKNDYTKAVVDKDGINNIFDGKNDITNGYFTTFGTIVSNLQIYTLDNVSIMDYANDTAGFLF